MNSKASARSVGASKILRLVLDRRFPVPDRVHHPPLLAGCGSPSAADGGGPVQQGSGPGGAALVMFYEWNQLQAAGLSITDPLFGRGG
jgi:hypothetical protein